MRLFIYAGIAVNPFYQKRFRISSSRGVTKSWNRRAMISNDFKFSLASRTKHLVKWNTIQALYNSIAWVLVLARSYNKTFDQIWKWGTAPHTMTVYASLQKIDLPQTQIISRDTHRQKISQVIVSMAIKPHQHTTWPSSVRDRVPGAQYPFYINPLYPHLASV